MKRLILTALTVTCAASVFAQGTVLFNNRAVGNVIARIYGPNATDASKVQFGNAATVDFPAGTTDWTGFPLLAGTGFSAQLFAAPTTGTTLVPVDQLVAASTAPTTFRTAAAAGFINGITATLAGVPGDTAVASIQMRVWDNQGGTVNDWATAVSKDVTRGSSQEFNLNAIGGTLNPAPTLNGLTSFNIAGVIPEPSTFALAGLGAAALLIFRRRK